MIISDKPFPNVSFLLILNSFLESFFIGFTFHVILPNSITNPLALPAPTHPLLPPQVSYIKFPAWVPEAVKGYWELEQRVTLLCVDVVYFPTVQ